MSAVRLEVETHIVAGASTSLQNLTKCVSSAGVQIDELVIASLAAAEATLTDTEKELGVIVADIGGGTTDMAVFVDGAVHHSAVIPVGGIHVNDVAIGLRTSLNLAEDVKIRHGTSNVAEVQPEELINVAVMGEGGGQTIQRRKLSEIIEARMRELYELINEEVARSGHGSPLPAGLVLTGGAHGWPGWPSWPGTCSRCRSGSRPRRGRRAHGPARQPAFSTSLGLLLWGARHWRGADRLRHPLPGQRRHGRARTWVRNLFPG